MKTIKFLSFILHLSLSLSLCFPAYSQQNRLTGRDQEEIAYQAQLTLSMYQDLLNVIAYKDLATEAEIQELIRNSYTANSRSQIFYSKEAIVEDNIKPSNLIAQHEQDKIIRDYLHYFDLAYIKSNESTVKFSDFEVSGLKKSKYLYIKVKYTSHFQGKHKEDTTSYQPVKRVAEFRVEKRKNKWNTFISSIVYDNPEKPFDTEEDDVEIKNKVSESGGTFSQLSAKVDSGNGNGSQEGAQEAQFSEKRKEQDSVFNHYLKAGERALAADNLEEAFAAFSEAEKINPFHQDLWQNLMQLTKAQNVKIKSAVNSYEYVKSNAEKALKARDYLRAKNLYSEALRIKPEDDQLKVEIEKLERTIQKIALMESKYAVGEYKAALKDYTKAIRNEKSNPDFYFGRGRVYEKLGEEQKAFKDYTKAIELDSDFIEALSSRANLYVGTGQFHKAVADYTLIISNPAYAAAFYPYRANVKKVMGDTKGAVEDYNLAIQYAPEVADHHYQKGLVFFGQQDIEAAIRAFSEAIEIQPDFVDAVYQRGIAYASLGSLQEASDDFEVARELGLEESQLKEIEKLAFQYYAKGEGAVEDKKYSQAIESFQNAILMAPSFGRAWSRAGDVYYILEDYENAISNYGQAVKKDPMSFAYLKRGMAYQQKGDSYLAGNDFRSFIPIGKELVANTAKKEEEKSSASSGLTFKEDRADALYSLGYAQLLTDQYVEALENLDMAIHSRKFFPKAYFARGAALYALQDYRRAVKDMEESIRMGLSEPIVFYSLGKAYMVSGRLDDAVLSYSHALKLDPEYVLAYESRALSHKQLENYRLAMDDVEKALKLKKGLQQDDIFLAQKGLIELHLQKYNEAEQSFANALLLNENNAWAMYGRASILALENKIEESLEWYRKAFQSGRIAWEDIKKDPLIEPVRKQKSFKALVKAHL